MYIWNNQHPNDCATAKFVISNGHWHPRGNGIGAARAFRRARGARRSLHAGATAALILRARARAAASRPPLYAVAAAAAAAAAAQAPSCT